MSTSNAVTLDKPSEVALEDMVDTTHLALREGAGLEDYGEAPLIVKTLVDTLNDIGVSFSS